MQVSNIICHDFWDFPILLIISNILLLIGMGVAV